MTQFGVLCTALRLALIGSTVSEPIGELLSVIGKDETLRRLRAFILTLELCYGALEKL